MKKRYRFIGLALVECNFREAEIGLVKGEEVVFIRS